ncbi:hypothetical protein FRC05_004731 [Tulasnella sp. 425]|nr:hypothetical protein FRC05_004731 [Tulasnella sp. 425]
MPLGPDPSLSNNQCYPSSRGLTSSNDYDPYDPSRMSSASLHAIEIDWSQAYRPSRTVVEDISSRDFSGLEMHWATIFDARQHRKPALPATWFEDDWEVAGVYPNHVLLHKAEKKRAVTVYNISETRISLIGVK